MFFTFDLRNDTVELFSFHVLLHRVITMLDLFSFVCTFVIPYWVDFYSCV